MHNKLLSTITAATLVVAGLATAIPSASAQSVSPSASSSPAATSTATATVRVVHAVPDAPAVDVYVDDKRTLTGLTFKRVTAYLSVPAGRHTIKVYPSTARGTGNPSVQADVELNPNWDYSVAAVGRLSSVQLKVFSDNLNLPGQSKGKVRAYHLSPNGPAVNVAVKGGDTIVRGLSFPNATDYLELEAKRYPLEVQSATDSKTVLDVSANITANSVQSIFVFGLVGDTPALSALTTLDRRGSGTPATGAEQSFGFIALAAAMVASTGLVLKKIAKIQELQ